MLRRRSKLASDSRFSSNSMEKLRNSAFFNVPGLFVGFSGKGLQDSDSVKSPTSPLDHRIFSNPNSSFVKSPGRSWDCSRVGLGLVDSLSDEKCDLRSPESRKILFGSQMRIINKLNPGTVKSSSNMAESLFSSFGSYENTESRDTDKAWQIYRFPKPSSDVFIASESKSSNLPSLPNFSSGSLPAFGDSINGFMSSISVSEIEHSEDYTRIICHGPNPKTTHIFGDCILEKCVIASMDCKNEEGVEGGGSHWIVKSLEASSSFPSEDFLSFCCFCKKKLDAGKDIYMFRGDKAFCSCSCREQAMLIEEEFDDENPANSSRDLRASSSFQDDVCN